MIQVDLTIDAPSVRDTLINFIRAEVKRAAFSRVVLGLSGGIDSALACYLAVEALGAPNVLVVRMPYRTSSASSLEDAQKVIDATGVPSLTLPITEMADALINRFPEMPPLRRGNIMARTRMITLFDQSAAFGGLVVGTGNKTEVLLGYTTLFGDSACAFNPLGDLYKTQVRQLSRYMGIPGSILEKAPSADLWDGQTDEGELGFTYAEVDQLLYLLVDEGYTPGECIESGYGKDYVRRVIKRIRASQFKRVPAPIAHLGSRTAASDFLNLSDWGERI